MIGHGAKLGRKMEAAVIALLMARNHEEAAKSVGVSLKTLQRWQKLPEFEKALRAARLAAFRQALGKLQQATGPAVTTLLKILLDPAAPLALKARCAYYILEQTRRDIETDDIEARLSVLEKAAEDSEQ